MSNVTVSFRPMSAKAELVLGDVAATVSVIFLLLIENFRVLFHLHLALFQVLAL